MYPLLFTSIMLKRPSAAVFFAGHTLLPRFALLRTASFGAGLVPFDAMLDAPAPPPRRCIVRARSGRVCEHIGTSAEEAAAIAPGNAAATV
jgi:hypothetical protein